MAIVPNWARPLEESLLKMLSKPDLTEKEKLEAQAAYYEAEKKQADQHTKFTVEQETEMYNEAVSMQKQRYIDGEIDTEVYQHTLELMIRFQSYRFVFLVEVEWYQ